MDRVQPYIDYFGSNPTWALLIVFFISFAEALLVIGLLVPSTVVLVGAGMLVGSGHLQFWPVFLATAIGALAGDQVSYWFGRYYGDHLKTMWPLRNYPALLASGEAFISKHGGKSIVIGRFVPGIKAVVAGVAGMLGMGQVYFSTVNALSSLLWAAVHLFPGILVGQGLAFAGELSGRLFVVLVELFVVLALAAWLIRVSAALLSPYLAHLLLRMSQWTRARRSKSMRRFSRAVSPQNPRSLLIIFFMAMMSLAVLSLGVLALSLVTRDALPNLDLSVMNFMREVRNSPADGFLIPTAMLGDGMVLLPVIAVVLLWLSWKKAFRAAAALLIAFGLASILAAGIEARPQIMADALDPWAFTSSHVARAATAYGLVAILVSHALGRWGKALVYAAASLLIVAIAYARIYLGADTVTGMLGGLLSGAVIVAAFGLAIEAMPLRRLRPWALLMTSVVALAAAAYVHVDRDADEAERLYTKQFPEYQMAQDEWVNGGWAKLALRRIDLAGKPEENFFLQWAGDVSALKASLAGAGWKEWPKWSWRDSLRYLDLQAPFTDVSPRPALHEGLAAQLTMTHVVDGNPEARLALRIYKTAAIIRTSGGSRPIVVVSLTRETHVKRLYTYAIPMPAPFLPEDLTHVRAAVAASGLTATDVSPALSLMLMP